MQTWREDIIKALEQSGGVARLADIYALVKSYRSNVPKSYQAMIRGTIESASSHSTVWDKKNDIFYSVKGIGEGIWGLRSMQSETPLAVDIASVDISGGTTLPGKSLTQVYRIIRDTKLCREIKKLHNYKCQLCGLTIKLPTENYYAEAHHIIPLGSPHCGADKAENIIVVCPNHHAMLDYGVVKLELAMINAHAKHQISLDSIAYHNQKIYGEREVVFDVTKDSLPIGTFAFEPST
jgi:predicted HNH restriction endonuclease